MILFVCTGNTCRSPLASVFMQKRLEEEGISKRVESAGIYGYIGQKASVGSINAANFYGLNLKNHEAQNLVSVIGIENALILTMTNAHKEYVQSMNLGKEVYTLYEYVKNERRDIVDPFGSNDEEYLKCAKELKELVDLIDLEKL
ncbi:MAG: low molecular weight protein arginine phosphatase [Defluviitaleaceae bacterium]|nr:low molecular weight protein arginine phosphatase [Defluviitaleaceae bacterium]